MKNKKIVFSTNSDLKIDEEKEKVIKKLRPSDQHLKIYLDRKGRKGKIVTLIKGFVGDKKDFKEMSKKLKKSCGVGGTAKNGKILIQGNFRENIIEILKSDGYNVKRVGG
ncbi:MAG: translation initiation factor [Candidatus Marinimicrobia bacterium]|nr:translation initiation factor [Candidatus Neomarinimicrobiota bacterium]